MSSFKKVLVLGLAGVSFSSAANACFVTSLRCEQSAPSAVSGTQDEATRDQPAQNDSGITAVPPNSAAGLTIISQGSRPLVDPVPQALPAVTISGFSCSIAEKGIYNHVLIGMFPDNKVEVRVHGISPTYGQPFYESVTLKTLLKDDLQIRADRAQDDQSPYRGDGLELTLKTGWGHWMKSFLVTQNPWGGALRANGKTFSLDCSAAEIQIVADSLWFTKDFDVLKQ